MMKEGSLKPRVLKSWCSTCWLSRLCQERSLMFLRDGENLGERLVAHTHRHRHTHRHILFSPSHTDLLTHTHRGKATLKPSPNSLSENPAPGIVCFPEACSRKYSGQFPAPFYESTTHLSVEIFEIFFGGQGCFDWIWKLFYH